MSYELVSPKYGAPSSQLWQHAKFWYVARKLLNMVEQFHIAYAGEHTIDISKFRPVSHFDFYANQSHTGEGFFLYGALLQIETCSAEHKHHRMLVFADLMSPNGDTFVVLERSRQHENSIWSFTREYTRRSPLARAYAIMEPKKTAFECVIAGVPVVHLSVGLLPIRTHIFAPKPWLQPEENRSRYFLLRGTKLGLSRAVLVAAANSYCNYANSYKNYQCHAQIQPSFCGCYTATTNGTGGSDRVVEQVLQVTVQFQPATRGSDLITVEDWVSASLTKLIFEDKVPSMNRGKSYAVSLQMRFDIEQLVQFVNNNGGWTILGWHRKHNRVLSKIISEQETTIHPTAIYPSFLTKRELRRKDLLLNCSNIMDDVHNTPRHKKQRLDN